VTEVQNAMAATGIPTFSGSWHPTAGQDMPPDTYAVYTTHLFESEHWDDAPRRFRANIYMNLWSKSDPGGDVLKVRSAMRAAGFGLSDERYSYEDDISMNLVAWTWTAELSMEVTP